MEDPKGRPLKLAPDLDVLWEFWPDVAEAPGSLSHAVGLEVADEVLRRTISIDQEFADTSPGGFRNRIREKMFYPDIVDLTSRGHPALFEEVRYAIACLPMGILEVIGMGADIGIATFPEPIKRTNPSVSHNIDEYNRRWRILLGYETSGAPGEVIRGIFVHELCHVLIGKSPAVRMLWRARNSFSEEAAQRANDAIEERAVLLACELGLAEETKRYLLHMSSLHPDAHGNVRFLGKVERYL